MRQPSAMVAYKKPGPIGGKLIREVIAFMRSQGVKLPISSHILIATSGGSDSIALARLLIQYGRRVVDPGKIRLLHVNHGWRGAESDADAEFVRLFARQLKVPCKIVRVRAPAQLSKGPKGESWEDLARQQRKKVFAREAARLGGALIMTAHHGDDLAETLLWRLFTGSALTHGGGIVFQHGVELRPLLQVRKQRLEAFLEEEGQSWREDGTNREGRFLRSRMRLGLMPTIDELFPKAVEHLIQAGLSAQNRIGTPGPNENGDPVTKTLSLKSRPVSELLFRAAGLQVRRAHWDAIQRLATQEVPLGSSTTKEMHLPGGWRLVKERKARGTRERWVLEKE